VEDFKNLGTTVFKKSCYHLGLSPIRLNELWTCTDDGNARSQAPGCQRSSFGSLSPRTHGPFEEEGEGTSIASDVVKVKDEDPDTPGYYLRSVDTRKPRDRNDSQISG